MVRSNCRPASTEKSPTNTTFDHGPGQFAGGSKVNGMAVNRAGEIGRSATKSLNSWTLQGVVLGRAKGASGVAVLPEPITNGVCAIAADARSSNPAKTTKGENDFFICMSLSILNVSHKPFSQGAFLLKTCLSQLLK